MGTNLENLIGRGNTAGKPAAGVPGRLYYDTTTSTLYRDNGSSWDAVEAAGGLTNPMDAAGDLIIGGASGTPTKLAKDTDGKVLTLVTGAPAWATAAASGGFPDQVEIPMMFPSASSGSITKQADQNYMYRFRIYTSAQNNYLEYPVLLRSGTWRLDVMADTDVTRCIHTVTLDGTTIGTYDCYGGSAQNVAKAITSISVATSGVKLLRFSALTRNASSSGWVLLLCAAVMTRTGA